MESPAERVQKMKADYEQHHARLKKQRKLQLREQRRRLALHLVISAAFTVTMFIGPRWLVILETGILLGWLGVVFWRLRPGRCIKCGKLTTVAVPLSPQRRLDDWRWWNLIPPSNRDGCSVFTCIDDFMLVTGAVVYSPEVTKEAD